MQITVTSLLVLSITALFLWTSCSDDAIPNNTSSNTYEVNTPSNIQVDYNTYYFYGIANLNGNIAKKLLEEYGVTVINLGCALESENTAHNRAVDSFYLHTKGTSVSGFIAQEMKNMP